MRRIAILTACLYGLLACNNEMIYDPDPVLEQRPQIQLLIPDDELVSVYSTANAYENRIYNLWVMMLNAAGTQVDSIEYINATGIVRNGEASQLLPQLNFKPITGRTMICIANSDIATNTPPATPPFPYSSINTLFMTDNSSYYLYRNHPKGVPMYGEFEWSPTNGYTCPMIRAVAKVQVQMGITTGDSDITGNFSAETVSYRLFNVGLRGQIQPVTPFGIGYPLNNYTSPHKFHLLQRENTPPDSTDVYLYEFQSSIRRAPELGAPIVNNKTFSQYRPCLMLYKDNSSLGEADTYYRLDFFNRMDSTYMDILRNRHYIFTINRIRSEGYTSVEEAEKFPGSNIEYTVKVTGNEFTQIVSNGQYAIVSNIDTSVVRIPILPNNGTIGYVKYQLPAEMSALPTGSITNSISLEDITPPITINITPTILTGARVAIILTSSTVTSNVTATLVLKLGNITQRIPLKLNITPTT